MTKPTQAQIEAANHRRYVDRDKLWALFANHYWDSFAKDRDLILSHISSIMMMAETEPASPSITAAALLRGRHRLGYWEQSHDGETIRENPAITAAIAAAAEVGDKDDVERAFEAGSKHGWESCAVELKRLEQHQFGENDPFAIGFNEAIREAQAAIRARGT